jgi:hypothetical protein
MFDYYFMYIYEFMTGNTADHSWWKRWSTDLLTHYFDCMLILLVDTNTLNCGAVGSGVHGTSVRWCVPHYHRGQHRQYCRRGQVASDRSTSPRRPSIGVSHSIEPTDTHVYRRLSSAVVSAQLVAR